MTSVNSIKNDMQLFFTLACSQLKTQFRIRGKIQFMIQFEWEFLICEHASGDFQTQHSQNPVCKLSLLFPEVHNSAWKCDISTLIKQTIPP